MNFHEIEHLREYEKFEKQLNLGNKQQDQANFATIVESIVKEPQTTGKTSSNAKISKSSRVSNINSNRSFEKAKRRTDIESFELGASNLSKESATILPFSIEDNYEQIEDNLGYPDELELLRQVRTMIEKADEEKE